MRISPLTANKPPQAHSPFTEIVPNCLRIHSRYVAFTWRYVDITCHYVVLRGYYVAGTINFYEGRADAAASWLTRCSANAIRGSLRGPWFTWRLRRRKFWFPKFVLRCSYEAALRNLWPRHIVYMDLYVAICHLSRYPIDSDSPRDRDTPKVLFSCTIMLSLIQRSSFFQSSEKYCFVSLILIDLLSFSMFKWVLQ